MRTGSQVGFGAIRMGRNGVTPSLMGKETVGALRVTSYMVVSVRSSLRAKPRSQR